MLKDYILENYLKDNKAYTRFIKKLASSIRATIEYKYWADTIRDKYTSCQKCGWSTLEGAKLEVHHEPLTLFEIIDAHVRQKSIKVDKKNDKIEILQTPQEIISDILKYHLDNQIGHRVLCECCHKREHSGSEIKFEIFENDESPEL